MKKNFITIALMLTILLVGCTNTNNQNIQSTNTASEQKVTVSPVPSINPNSAANTKVIVNELSSGEKGTFYLDMSREDVFTILKSKNVDTSSEIEITSYKESWDYGNKVLSAGGIRFSFDKAYKLYEIVIEGNFPTTLGLKIEDSLETMEKLYGKSYTASTTDKTVSYNYSMSSHDFFVRVVDGKVKTWGIQKVGIGKQVNQVPTEKMDDRKTSQSNPSTNTNMKTKWLNFSFTEFSRERELVKKYNENEIKDIEEGKFGSDRVVKIGITVEDINGDGINEIIAILSNRYYSSSQANVAFGAYIQGSGKIQKLIPLPNVFVDTSNLEKQRNVGIVKRNNSNWVDFIINDKTWSWDGKEYNLAN